MNLKKLYVYLVVFTVFYIGILIIVYLVTNNSDGNYSHDKTTPTNNVFILPTRSTSIKTPKITTTSSLSPTILTMTMTPFITYTNTLLPTITAQRGYEIWFGGSVYGYLLQYPINKWNEVDNILFHRNFEGCLFEDYSRSGSDRPPSSESFVSEEIILGGIKYLRVIIEEQWVYYYQVYQLNERKDTGPLVYLLSTKQNRTQCLQDAEEVLETILLLE